MNLRSSFIVIQMFVFLCCFLTPVEAATQENRANKIKAAYLLQFSKYVIWPAASFKDEQKSIALCILGQDTFGSVIDQVNSTFHDRTVEIKRIQDLESVQACHILFVDSNREQTMDDITTVVDNRPILIVGAEDGFLAKGGMINFVQVGKKLRFNIHLNHSEQNELQLSSKLLKVANDVK